MTDPAPHARVLSNGRYAVLITSAGTGYSTWNGYALTTWTADRTEDGEGFFIYLRNLERNQLWSIGYQPARKPADAYAASYEPGRVRIERLDDGIESRLEVCVAPGDDVEIRRVSLRNVSNQPQHLELTSYAELALNHPAAHAAHPAFSKLFVQTEYAAPGILLAHRRPRARDEEAPWIMHALLGTGPLQYDTDRARFIGRGRDLAHPIALTTGTLAGVVGNVLDPVFSLRRSARLGVGDTAHFTLLLGVARNRAAVIELAARYSEAAVVQAAFDGAGEQEQSPPSALADTPPLRASTSSPRAMGDSISKKNSAHPEPVEGSATKKSTVSSEQSESGRAAGTQSLLFDNGYGGFTPDGREYVIRLDGRRPPMPWVNVIANETFGFLVSESGAGYTWSRNSRENRLTPWYNDPVTDPYGEALYVRDEDARVFWSPLPGPVPLAAACEVRHGFGYTQWRHRSVDLEQEVLQFVPRHDPVKITRLRLTNTGDRTRRLSLFAYHRLVLGALAADSSRFVITEVDSDSGAILAQNRLNNEFYDAIVFAAAVAPPGAELIRCTGDRTAFVGRHGCLEVPAAVGDALELDGRTGAGLDPCAALQVTVHIEPGATVECSFLLGENTDKASARALVERYRRPAAIANALRAVRKFWTRTLSAVRIETPSPAIDLMVNGWLLYQDLSCRLWGRSAFYQSGGAFGFRDQLQDAAALIYSRPDLTRAQIVLHATHQFVEGDVLHWWHPPTGRGIRTHFSDDLLWLPYVTAFYVHTTGDWGVLDQSAGFVMARALEPDEDEACLFPQPAGEAADIYTHCCRALDRSLTCGAHGLPLMGTGDWNDGMNRVGREGRGESVWLGFFLYRVLGDFIPICERRAERVRAQRYPDYQAQLRSALDEAGWDGSWYRRAYYDDGTPLGSAQNEECRIDALAQAWAVLSKAAPPERAAQAMDAVERQLVSEEAGLIRLLTPPFDRDPHDPGYIKGYVPGIRENGGQYTHAAIWVVQALAELGRRERAAAYLEMLGPISHTRTPDQVAVYQVEPYVVAADIYGVSPHVGRGGWTWYTGSAGWMYRVALESVLGFRLDHGNMIRLKPCIPDHWPQFRITFRLFDEKTRYEIVVHNPTGCAATVQAVAIDGQPGDIEAGAARIPLVSDGCTHAVAVVLGS